MKSGLKQIGMICLAGLILCMSLWAQDSSKTKSMVRRLIKLDDHKRAAFELGPELIGLDPDEGLELVRAAWPDLANDSVKTGIMKAFAFSKNLPEVHPHVLQILDLGMTDESKEVRDYAAAYVRPYSLEDFTDNPIGYKQWYEANGQMSLEEVRIASRPRLIRKIDDLVIKLSLGDYSSLSQEAKDIGVHGDAWAIPFLIGLIEAEDSYETIYHVGYFGLSKMTGVRYDEKHDGEWWRRYWKEAKKKHGQEIQEIKIPDYRELIALGKKRRVDSKKAEAGKDVADIPSEKLFAGKDKKKAYFLIGAKEGVKPPKRGYKLLVVLPGGDGSESFHPFVKRIFKNGVPEGYLIAQLVSVKWTEDQKIVWPHKSNPVKKMKFGTDKFIEAVVADVKKRQKIDKAHVFTMSWSSSGPAAYAASLQKKTAIKGSYIAMSVFRRKNLPSLTRAKGRAYYIEHSPDDRTCPFWMAEQAMNDLTASKAKVEFSKYDGGHGWHGDIYGRIGKAIKWLEDNAK